MFVVTTAINFAEVGKHCQDGNCATRGTCAEGGVIAKDVKLRHGLHLAVISWKQQLRG
jgi:hypothetical protein